MKAQKAAVLTPIIISMCQLMADDGPNSSIIHRPDSRGDKSPLLVKKSSLSSFKTDSTFEVCSFLHIYWILDKSIQNKRLWYLFELTVTC